MFATVRAKLIAYSFVSLLFTILVSVAGYCVTSGLSDIVSRTQNYFGAINTQLQLNQILEQAQSEVLQIVREAKIGNTVTYGEALKSLDGTLKSLSGIVIQMNSEAFPEKTRQAVGIVRAGADDFAKSARSIATQALAGGAGTDVQLTELTDKFNKLKAARVTVNALIAADAGDFRNSAEQTMKNESTAYIAGACVLFVLLLFFAIYVYRGIANPLKHLLSGIRKVESGVYEVRMNMRRRDELSAVGRAFDKLLDERIASLKSTVSENERLNNSVIGLFSAMGALAQKDLTVRAPVTDDIIGTLGDAINQLTDVTATVLHHVTKVAGVVEDASERMKQQSDVVNEMAKEEDVIVVRLISNLETAMASIGEVAIFARDSNRAAAEATKSTESAMETVQATLSGMNAIRETISEMEKRIKRLAERSQEISQIVNLINTISERTHVLSLNAAMQAAMAGEAGRGFAVVAEEVQRLAENSRQATGQIAKLVQNIQVETNDTIATVNKTIEQVIKESELAHNAGERMRETHEATARLVRLVATIANSSAEQTKIAVVLRAAADEIAQFTEKTAEQLVAQNQSAASLVSASQKLVSAISVFKLPSTLETESEQTQIFIR